MQLRQEVAKLTERQQACESEVQRCRNEMQRADSGRRAQEQETGLSDQRRGHIEAEYEMYLRKEQLRIDFVNESQEMHRNAMDELQKAIAEVDQVRQRTLLEKETIEQEIERCNEAINKFQVHTEHFEGVCEHILLEYILLLATCLLCCKVCPLVPVVMLLGCVMEPAQELDKVRRQRAEEFRDKRYDMLEKFTELLIMQVCQVTAHACPLQCLGRFIA